MIVVLRPGALTTVQDLGRPARYRASGVPAGGAADPWAARAANRLVGNPDGAALLEITLTGPTLRFASPARVALVGAAFSAAVDGRAAPPLRALEVAAGAELELAATGAAARAWLAIAGGIACPLRLASAATDLVAAFGGHQGRALRAGDRLAVADAAPSGGLRRLLPELLAELCRPRLRALPGPDAALVEEGAEALAAGPFVVAARSDRRGVRLAGRALVSRAVGELRSQGVLPGTVQLPPAGEPIVLGCDAPVTGGYPWLAQVVAADAGRPAHWAPGTEVGFELVGAGEAERAWQQRERALAEGIVVA